MENKRTIALFKSIEYGYTVVKEIGENYMSSRYVKISHDVEIDFIPVEGEELLQATLAALHTRRQELATNYAQAVAAIDTKIQERTALPAP